MQFILLPSAYRKNTENQLQTAGFVTPSTFIITASGYPRALLQLRPALLVILVISHQGMQFYCAKQWYILSLCGDGGSQFG